MNNTYLEYSEDIDGKGKTYVLHIDRADLGSATFDNFDIDTITETIRGKKTDA